VRDQKSNHRSKVPHRRKISIEPPSTATIVVLLLSELLEKENLGTVLGSGRKETWLQAERRKKIKKY